MAGMVRICCESYCLLKVVLHSVAFGIVLFQTTRYITNLSYINYAFEALLINEFKGVDGFQFTSYTKPPTSVNVTGDAILSTFGYTASAMLPDACALVVMAVLFLLLTYFLLRLKARN